MYLMTAEDAKICKISCNADLPWKKVDTLLPEKANVATSLALQEIAKDIEPQNSQPRNN